MVNGLELLEAITLIAEEKNIEQEVILAGIVEGFQKAFERFFDTDAVIDVVIDKETGNIRVFQNLTIVSEVEDDWLEITLGQAQSEFDSQAKIGDTVKKEILFNEDFSRLAVFQVRQIVQQKIRGAERTKIYEKFVDKKGELIKGKIIGMNEMGTSYMVDFDGTHAAIQNSKIIHGETFEVNQYVNFYVEDIEKDNKFSQIVLSRVHPQFLVKLIEQEVPEVMEKIVEIKSASREPGKRAKVAVYSHNENIEPIGAIVGNKGARINLISSELKNEKIDVVVWSENQSEFIINAMAPVRVISVSVDEENGECDVIVPNEQLSLAIGKSGIAARLVANLIKIRINIMSLEMANEDAVEVLWNGNITQEQLTDPQFLENVNKRREKTFVPSTKPKTTWKSPSNHHENQQDLEAQLKALQAEIINDNENETFFETQTEQVNLIKNVNELELNRLEKETDLEEINANIKAFEALDIHEEEDEEVNDEYDEYYKS